MILRNGTYIQEARVAMRDVIHSGEYTRASVNLGRYYRGKHLIRPILSQVAGQSRVVQRFYVRIAQWLTSSQWQYSDAENWGVVTRKFCIVQCEVEYSIRR